MIIKNKTISLLIIIAMTFVLSTNAAAVNISNRDTNLDEALDTLEQEYSAIYGISAETDFALNLIESYRSDPMFVTHYLNDSEDALAMVVQVINSAIISVSTPQPLWTDGTIWAADGVPSYKQKLTNSCGTASALQVIIQQGGGNNISGTTYESKEQSLINETMLGAGNASSVYVYEVRDLINKYSPSSTKYAYIPCKDMDAITFRTLVLSSLTKDCPIVLHANTKYLGYYNSKATGHYIVGTHFFGLLEEFVVNDCNYRDEYTGIRSTTMTEIYNSVHMPNSDGSTRYLIYGA